MQIVVMVTSVVLSAIVSFVIAKKQLNHQLVVEQKEALKRHEEMLAKWIVISSDMVRVLQEESDHRDQDYHEVERALEKQFALIGLEYYDKQYDDFISKLKTFITQSQDIYHYDIHAVSIEQLSCDQHALNEAIRSLVAKEAQHIH